MCYKQDSANRCHMSASACQTKTNGHVGQVRLGHTSPLTLPQPLCVTRCNILKQEQEQEQIEKCSVTSDNVASNRPVHYSHYFVSWNTDMYNIDFNIRKYFFYLPSDLNLCKM